MVLFSVTTKFAFRGLSASIKCSKNPIVDGVWLFGEWFPHHLLCVMAQLCVHNLPGCHTHWWERAPAYYNYMSQESLDTVWSPDITAVS